MRTRYIYASFLLLACSKRVPPQPLPPPLTASIPAPTILEEPVTDAGAPKIEVQYSTRFHTDGDSAKRAKNITLVASKIDGLTVPAGSSFSFNEVVGPRTIAAGFVTAPTFFEGVHVDGLGGGICQVSSTLHAALMYGAYNVTEWHSHSRKVPYIAEGLDATVNWKDLDFRFVPDQDVVIHAIIEPVEPGISKLTIKVVGEKPRPKVRTKWVSYNPVPFTSRTVKGRLKKAKLHQKGEVGKPGYRVWQWPGGGVQREASYGPIPEVWIVPSTSS